MLVRLATQLTTDPILDLQGQFYLSNSCFHVLYIDGRVIPLLVDGWQRRTHSGLIEVMAGV
jgi:hypothetical protein